jgi:hypothetical protein
MAEMSAAATERRPPKKKTVMTYRVFRRAALRRRRPTGEPFRSSPRDPRAGTNAPGALQKKNAERMVKPVIIQIIQSI